MIVTLCGTPPAAVRAAAAEISATDRPNPRIGAESLALNIDSDRWSRFRSDRIGSRLQVFVSTRIRFAALRVFTRTGVHFA